MCGKNSRKPYNILIPSGSSTRAAKTEPTLACNHMMTELTIVS